MVCGLNSRGGIGTHKSAFQGEFLRYQMEDSGASVFITEEAYLGRFAAIEEGVPNIRTIVLRGNGGATSERQGAVAFSSLYEDDDSVFDVGIRPSDLAMLLYTSGTTGPSKGCMIPHGFICNMGAKTLWAGGTRENDVFWTACPLFHMGAAGLALGCVQLGATVAVYPRFSLSNFWPEIERSGATTVMVLSSMITLIANATDTEASLRCFGQIRSATGVPFTPVMQETWKRRFGVQIAGSPGFGMSEVCSITLCDLHLPAPPGSSGRRYEDFDVEVVDDNDQILGPGQSGEVVVRPRRPNIMFQGYWSKPEATVDIFRNLWFHTGDIGKFDEDGFFYWLDRKKDYLRRGGENISSFEMETVFLSHPEIEEVAVHAVKSDLGEDDVKVTAILVKDATISEEALCAWCIDKIPKFAVPRYIEFRDDLPRTSTAKVQKFQLREEGVTSRTWDRGPISPK